MGCHTSFHSRFRKIKYKELRDSVIYVHNKEILYLTNYFDNCHFTETKKDVLKEIKRNKTILKAVLSKKINKINTLSKLFDSEKDLICHKGYLYIEANYFDLFRVGNYPEDILETEKETFSFIEKQNIIEYNVELIKKFWTENPNGLITFG